MKGFRSAVFVPAEMDSGILDPEGGSAVGSWCMLGHQLLALYRSCWFIIICDYRSFFSFLAEKHSSHAASKPLWKWNHSGGFLVQGELCYIGPSVNKLIKAWSFTEVAHVWVTPVTFTSHEPQELQSFSVMTRFLWGQNITRTKWRSF